MYTLPLQKKHHSSRPNKPWMIFFQVTIFQVPSLLIKRWIFHQWMISHQSSLGDSPLHYPKWDRSLHPFDNAACNGTLLSAFQLLFRRVAQFFASVQQSYQIPGSKLSPQKRHVKDRRIHMGIFGIWWGLIFEIMCWWRYLWFALPDKMD